MSKVKNDGAKRDGRWNATYGTYLSGHAAIDGADVVAIDMEQRWGRGRLRLLVSTELREKFDRQRFLFNAAIRHGDLQEVQLQSARMVTAWQALDKAASNTGQMELMPKVWETTLKDGTVVAIIPDDAAAHRVIQSGRRMVVYTLEEIGLILDHYGEIIKVKEAMPGSIVTVIRKSIPDPLDAIRDGVSLEETFNDAIPDFGQ